MIKIDNSNMCYIRFDNRKYEKKCEKLHKGLRRLFIKVSFEKIENGTIITIPKYIKNRGNVIDKINTQIIKFLLENKIENIVLDDEVASLNKELKKTILENNKKILNGKYIMKNMLIEIIEYIFKISKKNSNLENIHLFINEYNPKNIYLIEELVKRFKTVNIVTENIKQFKRLENKYFNQGILITVSNNKRKSARNAKYIVNIDFEKESFEQYTIDYNSIIINLTDETTFFERKLKGVLVNNIEIDIDKNIKEYINEFYGNIKSKIYIESLIITNMFSDELYNGYNIEITQLIGIRGPIQKCEFLT